MKKGSWGWWHQTSRKKCPDCGQLLIHHFRTLRGKFQSGYSCEKYTQEILEDGS
ncbi:hypothetical protein ES702_01811 [subsurface metagenome]